MPTQRKWLAPAAFAFAFGSALALPLTPTIVSAQSEPAQSQTGKSETAKPDPNKLAYGKHLAQECTTCHRLDGSGTNIPSIVGLKPDYFITTMNFYKSGARNNPAMNSVAQMLGDEQLEALAAYFETVKAPAKAAPARKK